MIKFTFYKDKAGQVVGFKAVDHSKDVFCAAVSMLTQNTVNSIESFTQAEFSLGVDPDGGFMEFIVTDKMDDKAALLLKSLELGITDFGKEYGKAIDIKVKEV